MRCLVFAFMLCAAPLAEAAQHHLLIVTGLGGTDEYRAQFANAAVRLHAAARAAELDAGNIVVLAAQPLPPDAAIDQQPSDRESLLGALRGIGSRAEPGDRVFVVLIGHGNPRGDGAAFNLPGPDITATELGAALDTLGLREPAAPSSGAHGEARSR